jgi:hypothetical protein
MALEINEIGIHFRVPDQDRPTAQRAPQARPAGTCSDPDREQVVDDCVRRVLQLLKAQRER